MRVCIHCGHEVPDNAVICPTCGANISYANGGEVGGQTYAQHAPRVDDEYSALSIAGFILSFFTALIGLIISIVAFNEAKRSGSAKSKSFAKAGIIISSVEMGLGVLAGVIYFVFVIAVLMGIGAGVGGGAGYYSLLAAIL